MNNSSCDNDLRYVVEYAELCFVAILEAFSETSVSYGAYVL